jgi:hypothetical protein
MGTMGDGGGGLARVLVVEAEEVIVEEDMALVPAGVRKLTRLPGAGGMTNVRRLVCCCQNEPPDG